MLIIAKTGFVYYDDEVEQYFFKFQLWWQQKKPNLFVCLIVFGLNTL